MASLEKWEEDLSLYHIFCIETFENILSNKKKYSKNFNNSIFKYALKSGLIGQYAETYCIDGNEMKFWNIDYHSKKHKVLNVWHVLLASKKAIEGIREIQEGTKENSKKTNLNTPYYEHIEPKSITYEKLINLENSNKDNIRKSLQYCKLVLITKEESLFLDSKRFNLFRVQDIEILESWKKNNFITTQIFEEAKESMKKDDNFVSARDNGTAYARLAHLVAYGVEFEWQCYSNEALPQGKIISEYLKNDKRIYSLEK